MRHQNAIYANLCQFLPFLTPRAHGRRMAGVIEALIHLFLFIYMWFEALKSFNVNPGSQGDLAIVTWFWPQNRPFLTPPCPREKDGRGQSGPNSCFPINIDVIWGVQVFPRWFQGSWVTLPLWPDFDLKISHFWPPVHTGEGWQGWKRHLTMFSYWYKCDLRY